MNVILTQLGVTDPSAEDVARVMRWADGYLGAFIDAIAADQTDHTTGDDGPADRVPVY
jgi:hypothetical protein